MFFDTYEDAITAVRQFEQETNTRFLVIKTKKCGLLFVAILVYTAYTVLQAYRPNVRARGQHSELQICNCTMFFQLACSDQCRRIEKLPFQRHVRSY